MQGQIAAESLSGAHACDQRHVSVLSGLRSPPFFVKSWPTPHTVGMKGRLTPGPVPTLCFPMILPGASLSVPSCCHISLC